MLSFTKKWKTRKEAKFDRGDDNSLINNAIYLLFIIYTNMNVASFCDFYSSGKAQFIICAIVAICILALQRYFSRHNYDLFWKIGSIYKNCFVRGLEGKLEFSQKYALQVDKPSQQK